MAERERGSSNINVQKDKKAGFVTFYQPRPFAAVVWDPQTDRALCEFDKHVLQTDDPKVIARLRELKYPETMPVNPFGDQSGFVKTEDIQAAGVQIPGTENLQQ